MLSVQERQQLESNFRRDVFRELRGPCWPPGQWHRELQRIDNRLVLRWMPLHGQYMVFREMASGKLWHQPVHRCVDAGGRMRAPNVDDLRLIQKARTIHEATSHREREALFDQRDQTRERARRERIDRETHDRANEIAGQCGITRADLGVTRKSFSGAGKT